MVKRSLSQNDLFKKARGIKLVLTDVDGVLTDSGVYYSERGEELKRFSVRDGMAVERLLKLANIETGIISGENSPSVRLRAEKLGITELHLGIREKIKTFKEILAQRGLQSADVAYIGDDVNDLDILKIAGLSAAPSDAMPPVLGTVDFVCIHRGGYGAFRELAELILATHH